MTIAAQLKSTGIAEVIIVLRTPAEAAARGAAAERQALASAAGKLGTRFRTPELAHDSVLLEALRPSVRGRGHAATATLAKRRRVPYRFYPNLGVMYGTVDRKGLAALRTAREVERIVGAPQFSLIRPTHRAAAEPTGRATWGIRRLGVPELWQQGLTGNGVLVGHLDTGVDGRHPALRGAIAHFAEFDWIGNPVPGARPHDTDEHGTHTAGTIAGRMVQGVSFGVAPGASLASAIVIEGGNVIARILAGMDWTVGLKVRILSMSLGVRGYDESFRVLTQLIRRRRILPVFAIGNEGPGTSRSPGNYYEALSVGACDARDFVADFSSSQRFARTRDPLVPDVVAPGVDVLSCVPNQQYALMSGTSMATPHVAGLAALLIEAKPNITLTRLERALLLSCRRPGTMLRDRANRGVPDGPQALTLL